MKKSAKADPALGHAVAASSEQNTVETPGNRGANPLDARRQRLLELVHETLAMKSPLEANLGIVSCDLMELAGAQKQRLTEAMAQQPKTLEDLDILSRAFDQFLRVTKQIETYAQLQIRFKEMRSGAGGKIGAIARTLEASEETAN
jgi:hypothetical protein